MHGTAPCLFTALTGVCLLSLVIVGGCDNAGDVPDGVADSVPRIPVLEGVRWKIGSNPHYGDLMPAPDARQPEVVDHGFLHLPDGTWELWACVRHVSVGRIFYGWGGASLEHPHWRELGVTMRADRRYGESVGGDERLQAPYFQLIDGVYHCFYGGGWSPTTDPSSASPYYQICLATSRDGRTWTRRNADGRSMMFEGPGYDRDPMVLKIGDLWYCYYSSTLDNRTRGFMAARTSPDLEHWSDYTIIMEGGSPGNGPWSAECPFVVALDGYFYLFRTQTYRPEVTHVYRSRDPLDFGVHDDATLIATLPVAAPELIQDGDQWYISSTDDYQGITLQRLRWDRQE